VEDVIVVPYPLQDGRAGVQENPEGQRDCSRIGK